MLLDRASKSNLFIVPLATDHLLANREHWWVLRPVFSRGGSIFMLTVALLMTPSPLKNADPNVARDNANGDTALVVAAQRGDLAIMTLLMEKNANPNVATTDDGVTPLFLAAGRTPLGNRESARDADGLRRQKGGRHNPAATPRCGSLLRSLSADAAALLMTSSHSEGGDGSRRGSAVAARARRGSRPPEDRRS